MADKPVDNLAELQRAFAHYLRSKRIDGAHHSKSEQHPTASPSATLQERIVGADAHERQTRLSVYYEAYSRRLIDALAADFPVTRRAIGIEPFEQYAQQYFNEHPSTQPSIRWVGQYFVGWLEQQTNTTPTLPAWLYDLAQFEWAQDHAFDAPDQPSIPLETLAPLTPEQWAALRFKLHPSVRSITTNWSIEPLWRHYRQDKQAPDFSHLPTAIHPEQTQPQDWVIWRRTQNNQHEVRYSPLDELTARIYKGMAQGQTFSQLCELIYQSHTEGDTAQITELIGIIKAWHDQGIISDFAIAE